MSTCVLGPVRDPRRVEETFIYLSYTSILGNQQHEKKYPVQEYLRRIINMEKQHILEYNIVPQQSQGNTASTKKGNDYFGLKQDH